MTTDNQLNKTTEPIWWALFSAGGVCFALFVPAVAIFFMLLLPLGLIELNYQQAQAWFFSFFGLIFTGAVLVLPAFHAVHRVRHGLHDLKVRGHQFVLVLCYGLASLFSVLCLLYWGYGYINS